MIPLKDVIPPRATPVVTIMLIVINLLVFLAQLLPDPFIVAALPVSVLMHTSGVDFAVNVAFLWLFGENVEDRMGHRRFAIFYALCGLSTAIAHTLAAPPSAAPIVGASGAVAGVLGAYFVLYPRSRILTFFPLPLTLVEVPAVFFLSVWFVLQFGMLAGTISDAGTTFGGIAPLISHVAGFATGAALCVVLKRPMVW